MSTLHCVCSDVIHLLEFEVFFVHVREFVDGESECVFFFQVFLSDHLKICLEYLSTSLMFMLASIGLAILSNKLDESHLVLICVHCYCFWGERSNCEESNGCGNSNNSQCGESFSHN